MDESRLKISHLVRNEKFIDSVYVQLFSTSQAGHYFYLDQAELPAYLLRYTHYCVVSDEYWKSDEYINELCSYDAVIIHSYFHKAQRVAERIAGRTIVVLFGFGYDYNFFMHQDPNAMLRAETQQAFPDKQSPVIDIDKKLKIFSYLDFIATVLPEEYERIKYQIPEFKPQYVDWRYFPVEFTLNERRENQRFRVQGDSILVPNSASITSNHIDVFHLLSAVGIGERKVICPLSYGPADVAERVCAVGKELFASRFIPVTEFYEYYAYVELLLGCQTAVFGHIRQQGLGVFSMLLRQGATIFIDEVNPIYAHFKREGAVIFSLQDLQNKRTLIDYKLTEDEQENNYKVWLHRTSPEKVQEKTMNVMQALLNKITTTRKV